MHSAQRPVGVGKRNWQTHLNDGQASQLCVRLRKSRICSSDEVQPRCASSSRLPQLCGMMSHFVSRHGWVTWRAREEATFHVSTFQKRRKTLYCVTICRLSQPRCLLTSVRQGTCVGYAVSNTIARRRQVIQLFGFDHVRFWAF